MKRMTTIQKVRKDILLYILLGMIAFPTNMSWKQLLFAHLEGFLCLFVSHSSYPALSLVHLAGTIYTSPAGCPYLMNSTTVGGKSWTKNWLVFDNS